MMMYIEVYLSDVFTVVTEKDQKLSPSPTSWCFDFVRESITAINKSGSWSPFYFCVDYFVSILPFAFRATKRPRIKLMELMKLVDEQLEQDDLNVNLLNFLTTLKNREKDIWQAWDIGEQKIAAGIKAPRE
jgi:hypothetical protein